MAIDGNGFLRRLFSWRKDRDEGVKILANRMDEEMDSTLESINKLIGGEVGFKGPIKGVFGTKQNPAFSFEEDTNSGIARTGEDEVTIVAGGKSAAKFTRKGMMLEDNRGKEKPLTEVLQTLRGHIQKLWTWDYSGMGGLVKGMKRLVKVAGGHIKITERDNKGKEVDIFDSRAIKPMLRQVSDNGGTLLGKEDVLILGSGESANTTLANVNPKAEHTHIASDSHIYFYTACQKGWASRKTSYLSTDGQFYISGQKSWHAGNDGAKSGLDADKVDGLHASQFLRSDANDTITGLPYFSRNADEVARFGYKVGATRNTYLSFYRGGTKRAGILRADSRSLILRGDGGADMRLHGAGDVRINGKKIWHDGNTAHVNEKLNKKADLDYVQSAYIHGTADVSKRKLKEIRPGYLLPGSEIDISGVSTMQDVLVFTRRERKTRNDIKYYTDRSWRAEHVSATIIKRKLSGTWKYLGHGGKIKSGRRNQKYFITTISGLFVRVK